MPGTSHYYHITPAKLADRIILHPSSGGVNWGECEAGPDRICVGLTPEECFMAVPFAEDGRKDWHVYRTAEPVKGIPADPNIVDDADVTREHWLTLPTVFVRVATIPARRMTLLPRLRADNFTGSMQSKVRDYIRKHWRFLTRAK